MSWCDNCKKTGFRKADIEFCEDTRQVLCHGCYALAHPSWMPPNEYVDMTDGRAEVVIPAPKVGITVQVTDDAGITASLTYGNFSIAISAPIEDLRKIWS